MAAVLRNQQQAPQNNAPLPLNANSKDAALVLQLSPGTYTVQISGAGNTAGTVLVEIYDADL